jgi:UDP-N-acetylglucosamine acyltransferase
MGNPFIHPSAMVHKDAVLGFGNIIHAGVIITSQVEIGNDNEIYPYTVIGTDAEHRGFIGGTNQKVKIGDRNIIREFVTINNGTIQDTEIGNECYFLRGSHIGHDCLIKDKVTLSCNALIGGESVIFEGANLGLGAVVHQRQVIGHYSMIGMNSTVTKTSEILPFGKFVGSPAKWISDNTQKRVLFDEERAEKFIQEYFERIELR